MSKTNRAAFAVRTYINKPTRYHAELAIDRCREAGMDKSLLPVEQWDVRYAEELYLYLTSE